MTSKRPQQPAGGGSAVEEQKAGQNSEPDLEGLVALDLPSAVTIADFSNLMGVDPVEVIKGLMRSGYMLTMNDVIERDLAELIAPVFGYSVLPEADRESGPGSLVVSQEGEDPEQLVTRPPVVTILGHVDHGKTTLLDAVRNSKIVDRESGGITQHIGAYQVEYNGHPITFLDTPGHEAFTAMRARGAQVTDIAVLVVAADDGIMPQTLEAIDHARAAEVPIIVAINKIDAPNADVERVKRQLAEQDLLIEEWGGDVIASPVSALTGEGIPDLLESMQVVAEVGELKANPTRPGRAVVVEARRDKSKGTITTALVQTGTLGVGQNVVARTVRGRIRAMFDDRGTRTKSVGPSQPVEILGIDELLEAGDIIEATPDEKTAREIVERRTRESEREQAAGPTLEDVYARIEAGEVKGLNLIVKTDVQGSIDAMRTSLENLNTEKTRVNVIHSASGSITESDVLLAVASSAIIVGFNSVPEPGARMLANQEGVDVRFYDVIYDLIDDVENALKGLLEPEYREVVEGQATVRAVFSLGRRAKVAGIFVTNGLISRGATIRVIRGGQPLFNGPIASLKHFKDDVREVRNGLEGGVTLTGFEDFHEGDLLEAHRTELAD
jgi:translation initiation factor IF-2